MASNNLTTKLNLAAQSHENGAFDQAEKLYNEVLEEDSSNFDALHLLALVKHQQGDHASAISLFNKALAINDNFYVVYANLGSVFHYLGSYTEALDNYNNALLLEQNHVPTLICRGNILMKLGKNKEALASFDQALSNTQFDDTAITPEQIELLNNQGLALLNLKEYENALATFDRILLFEPNDINVLTNKAIALLELGRYEAAIIHCDKILSIQKNNILALEIRARILVERDDYQEALNCYNKIIAIDPTNIDMLLDRGRLLDTMRLFDAALADFTAIINIDSECWPAYWAMACHYLTLGEFELGWKNFESRLKFIKTSIPPSYITQPLWHGNESLTGKKILLWSEQKGFGESIQFSRYVENVLALGAQVFILTHAPLKTLFSSIAGISGVIIHGEPLPYVDYQCPILSLPHRFKTTLDNVPKNIPYLFSDALKIQAWKQKLTSPYLKVGIVWRSDSKGRVEARRYIPLEKLIAIFPANISIIVLQKVIDEDDRALLKMHPNILNFEDELHDFSDTAALIECLDLVISVDTSVAHLVGAMGKPVWILLQVNPDWRWMLDRQDSPWYASAKLFRQKKIDRDWDNALEAVSEELKKEFVLNRN